MIAPGTSVGSGAEGRRGGLGAKLLLAASSAAVVPLLAEAALRVAGHEPAARRPALCLFDGGRRVLLDCYPTNPRGHFDVDLRDASVLARYRALGVRRLDTAVGRAPFCVECRYNATRYRGGEIPPRRLGVRRVAVLGDSFTEGQGVREADTFPRVLEARLLAAEPGRWEVVNCGRRASDFPELAGATEEALALEPDLLVYALVPNDPERSGALREVEAEAVDLIEDHRQAGQVRRYGRWGGVDSRLLAFVRDRLERGRVRRAGLRFYLDLFGEPNRAGLEATLGHLRRMRALAEARGARLLVADWPILVGLEGDDPLAAVGEAVGRLCAEAGVPRHDLRRALAGRRSESLWVHPVDMHPSELAHRLAAESLVGVVREMVSAGGGAGPAR